MRHVQDDCVLGAVGLTQLVILGRVELEDRLEITIRYRRDKVPCLRCDSLTVRRHESSFQHKKDRKLRDKRENLTRSR